MNEKNIKISEFEEKIEKLTRELKVIREKFLKSEQDILRLIKELETYKDLVKKHEEQRRELEQLNDHWENSTRYLEYTKQELEEKLYHAEEAAILIKSELEEISVQKETEIQRLKDEIKELKNEINMLNSSSTNSSKIQELESALSKALKDQKDFEEKYKMARINKYNSSLSEKEESTTAVRVIVKVRPFLEGDGKNQCLVCNETEISVESKKIGPAKCFMFEKVLGPEEDLDYVFEDLRENLRFASRGGNSCILAYGQTGSGKTYTMSGVLTRSLQYLEQEFEGKGVSMTLQIIEVYNEQVRNLLTNDPLSKNWKDITNMAEIQLGTAWTLKAKDLIKKSCLKRQTKATDSNEMSSRSHCIYTLRFAYRNMQGKIQFVDLAGSERINKSKVTGEALKETLHINKSLSALQDVITALETKSEHIPYRNSVLTRILQPTLGGAESKVTVILACSPAEDSVNETLCTLALGTRIKSVDLCWALKKNIKSIEVEKTLGLLEKERSEKLALVRKLEKLERDFSAVQLAMKEKELRIASMGVIIQQTEKKYLEKTETYKKEMLAMKQRQLDESKKMNLSASTDADTFYRVMTPKNEEKKKPVVVLQPEEKIVTSSSCKNFKILDISKRFVSSSPENSKKAVVVPKVGKSQTPSRQEKKPLIVKSGKQVLVKNR
jgi:kinesin family protein C2/C3